MIVFPISVPTSPNPESAVITPREVVAQSRSPYSSRRQVYEHQGGHWLLSFTLPELHPAEVRRWSSWITSLRGVRGTFLMGNPAFPEPAGVATGAPVVDGGGQTGLELATRGWTAGVNGILLAGDYIQVGAGADTRLHMVTADADSDGSGNSVLDIWPRLRTSPADGSIVVTSNPQGIWQLRTNENPWEHRAAQKGRVTIEAMEAL